MHFMLGFSVAWRAKMLVEVAQRLAGDRCATRETVHSAVRSREQLAGIFPFLDGVNGADIGKGRGLAAHPRLGRGPRLVNPYHVFPCTTSALNGAIRRLINGNARLVGILITAGDLGVGIAEVVQFVLISPALHASQHA